MSHTLYKPLPPHSTRLIRVCYQGPGQNTYLQLVTCAFKIVGGDSKYASEIPYWGISYTWGDASTLFPCRIRNEEGQSCTLDITETLLKCLVNWSALTRNSFREDQHIWVDQVAINQQDLAEKASHVQQMRHIYKAAKGLMIWLGPRPKALEKTINRLKGLRDSYAEHEEKLLAFEDGLGTEHEFEWHAQISNGLLSNYPRPEDAAVCDCVIQIFNSPWFSRAWILQEAAAVPAHSTLLHWDGRGTNLTTFEFLSVLAIDLAKRHWDKINDESWLRRLCGSSGPITLQRIRVLRWHWEHSSGHHRMTIDGMRLTLSLWDLFEITRPSQATDQRDKIFCMLSFSSDVDPNDPILHVDYNVSMEVLLARLIRWHLLKYKNLDFLSHCDYDRDNIATNDGLPSWMPDLVHHKGYFKKFLLYELSMDRPLYAASGPLPFTSLEDDRGVLDASLRYLKLAGAYLMEVKDLVFPNSSQLAYVPYNSDWEANLVLLLASYRKRLSSSYREFWAGVLSKLREKQQHLRPSGINVNTLYERVLMADQLAVPMEHGTAGRRISRYTDRRASEPYSPGMASASTSDHIMDSASTTDTTERSEIERAIPNCENGETSLFTCGQRGKYEALWVGSCTAGRLMPDDEVWMLRGGSVLYVLRPLEAKEAYAGICLDLVDGQHGERRVAVGEKIYGYVAQCYVHGLMDGEVLEMMGERPSREPIEGMDRELRNILLS